MNILMINPMQHISPPPCFFAILPQLHLVGHPAAPAMQLLFGEIIMHVDVVLMQIAAMLEHDMLGLSVMKLDTPKSTRCAVCLDGLQSRADLGCPGVY